MPYITFSQNDFKPIQTPGEYAPVAQKIVQLSGRQKKLRITGAASMLSYLQSTSNNNATMAPFNIKYGDPSSAEKYFLDTRCKDTFDVTIPFDGKNQIGFYIVWKGMFSWYLAEERYSFGLDTPMEISIHEILE